MSEIPDLQVVSVLAALPVADLEPAIEFHSRLFGRAPDHRPMDGLADWDLGGAGTVQVVLDVARAGGGLVTLEVGDLEVEQRSLGGRGVAVAIDRTRSATVLFATVEDPDGNAVTLVQRRS